jgi:hypothetical protein
MGFVQYKQRIATKQAGVIRSHLPRHSVTLKNDYIDSPNDNRRCGRIFKQLAVVNELPSQC